MVYKVGDPIDGIYIIKLGEVEAQSLHDNLYISMANLNELSYFGLENQLNATRK